MRSFTVALGSGEAVIFAPLPGELDPAVFRACFPPDALYGLDVESTALTDLGPWDPDYRLRLVQVATTGYAWVLRMDDEVQRQAVIGLLSDETVSFCSHTDIDVMGALTDLGVDITARYLDTRTLAAMAAPDDRLGGKDLKTLATSWGMPQVEAGEKVLHERFREMWTGRRNAKKADIEAFGWANIPLEDPAYLVYAGLDAIAARRLADLLVPATQAPATLLRTENWLTAQAARIRARGMRVDREMLQTLTDEAARETGEAEAVIKELTDGIPARSPRIQDWLGEHGVDWRDWQGARTEKGAPSLAKDNVKLLLDFPLDGDGRTVAQQLIRFKGHQDMLNKTKGVWEHLAPDGRVHPVLNTIGAVTGRMSSAGPNFQNFSKKDPRMRGCFVPDDGKVLLTADFDQIELRVLAALAGEQKMIDVILAGGDLHQLTVDEIGKTGIEITRDVGKMTGFLCVPLDSEILTRGGWKKHDQVQIGDETLGYDAESGTMRWTPIQAVHHYDETELVRLRNGQSGWSAVCTPDHRWVEERRRFVGNERRLVRGFVKTSEINTESRLLLSAVADTEKGVDLTPAECAVIGWVLTDGSTSIAPLTGRTSQGLNGWKRKVRLSIYQSKAEGIAEIRRVLETIPHREYIRKPVGDLRPLHDFTISPEVGRSIWQRSGLLDGRSVVELVLLMSTEQRAEFSRAAFCAEGHVNKNGQRSLSQNVGDVCDALELAAFLDGNYVRRNKPSTKGNRPNYNMVLSKPRITGQRLASEPAGTAPVWCVTTGLGSWVMRQENHVMLTGNCVYGGGGKALAEQANIPLEAAQQIVSAYRERYPAIADFTRELGQFRDSIRTVSRRRIPVKRWANGDLATYANINYEIQSSSRDVLVDAWYYFAQERGHADAVWFAIHDELVLEVPEDRLPEMSEEIETAMRFDFLGVPISASAVPLIDEAGVSRWMTSKNAEKIAAAKAMT